MDVQFEAPECACDGAGYDVKFTYTVERFVVDGTLKVYEDGVLIDTVTLTGFTGEATTRVTVPADTPGAHVWKAELDVTPTGGGTPGHAEDEAAVKVCETPKVSGIPDQVGPFQTFDLDDFLTYGGGLLVTWTASGVPDDWTLTMDADNVVTVVAPGGASPADVTFTASIECCTGVLCSGSDTATFTPNRSPDCTQATPSQVTLWPPNNKFVPITVLGVTDPDSDAVTISVDEILQDEPVDTFGDGNFAPDGKGVGLPRLRCVRSVPARRRSRATAGSITSISRRRMPYGLSCSGEVLAAVPHDQNKTPIDGGPLYDSTTP